MRMPSEVEEHLTRQAQAKLVRAALLAVAVVLAIIAVCTK
jgi:hypothetical protein